MDGLAPPIADPTGPYGLETGDRDDAALRAMVRVMAFRLLVRTGIDDDYFDAQRLPLDDGHIGLHEPFATEGKDGSLWITLRHEDRTIEVAHYPEGTWESWRRVYE